MTISSLVKRRGFRDLLIGQGVSALGDWMGTIAFMALALKLTGSPTAVGGILTLRLLPAALGGPLATKAVRKWDRRRTMLAMDAFRFLVIAAVPLIQSLWWIYLCAAVVEAASIVFLPARDSSIPDLVGDDDLSLADGLVLGSSYGTIPFGAGAFAAVAALPIATIFHRQLALVFWIDALTFLVSFSFIYRLRMLGAPTAPDEERQKVRFRDAFKIPLVRAVMPATAAIALGLGALFSLGIVFVRNVLSASDTEFGVLIALFGIGAALGLGLLQLRRKRDPLLETRLGVAAIGGVVAVFSLAGNIWIAYVGALAFGAGASFTLASGMGALQSRLDGTDRVLAFAAFHVVIRLALSLAAIGAGVAAQLLHDVRWPFVGQLEPSRVVLLSCGLLTVLASVLVSERLASPHLKLAPAASPATSPEPEPEPEPEQAAS
ncbi:MAG TPA: MFS transporter [Acidimicrobiia bacterium]|nr:MFS transporter [Acidimicrobiia bacterium]